MKTLAVRLYAKEDLRLEAFELPEMKEDEILAKVYSDSLCMSSYKAAKQGAEHKRVNDDCAVNPVIIGHEFCGEIIKVGEKWKAEFHEGEKFAIQPSLNNGTLDAPGYSFHYVGGDATYVVIPSVVMEYGCLLKYDGETFFGGSLAEPMSCIVGAFHANYHTDNGVYVHKMGIIEGGKTAILAGVGPMGLGAIEYALNCDRRPGFLVVTDIDDARLKRAESIFSVEYAKDRGVNLVYLNTGKGDGVEKLMELSLGSGYDDVFVFAPVRSVVEDGNKILAKDGCLNFFAGPTNSDFSAEFNFYNVHYASTHVVGTTGGSTADMIESLKMMGEGKLNPSVMITHVGGLNSVVETTLNLPNIKGGKKLVYNEIDMPMTAIEEFEKLGENDKFFKELAAICKKHNNLWNGEAEKYLLKYAKKLQY